MPPMADLSPIIAQISAAADKHGLAEFARIADVPYTTALDWRARGWRPRGIETLEKFAAAAGVAALSGAEAESAEVSTVAP